ncbi:hypothetical protein Mapa_010048 [Marchantia paleacea]|nr:hypothetical protein Mapa_010048 [Marchantia paleacea]
MDLFILQVFNLIELQTVDSIERTLLELLSATKNRHRLVRITVKLPWYSAMSCVCVA